MARDKMKSQGKKTHEQFVRTLERKDDVPKAREMEQLEESYPAGVGRGPRNPEARQSERLVSRRGMNQESQHNKHNDPGQSGHKPQGGS